MGGDEARRLYEYFYQKVQQGYAAEKVKNGVFQAMMEVALVNDGPVGLFQGPDITRHALTDAGSGYAGALSRRQSGFGEVHTHASDSVRAMSGLDSGCTPSLTLCTTNISVSRRPHLWLCQWIILDVGTDAVETLKPPSTLKRAVLGESDQTQVPSSISRPRALSSYQLGTGTKQVGTVLRIRQCSRMSDRPC